MNPEDQLWIVGVSAVVFVTYLPNLILSYRRWRQERGYRAIRSLFHASMLALFGLAVLTGSLRVAASGPVPELEWILGPSTVIRIASLAVLLIGGLVSWATWIVENRRG